LRTTDDDPLRTTDDDRRVTTAVAMIAKQSSKEVRLPFRR